MMRGRIRRVLVTSTVLSLALMSTLLASAAGAQQPVRTCDGKVATIVGTPGDDLLRGTEGPDVIVGLQGNDTIRALGGDDTICAGKGDDGVFGGLGFDVIFGAQGNDVIYAANGSNTAANRQDTKGSRIFGGAGNDMIYGSNRWDRMQGGTGNDVLRGYEGRDWMRGGADRDFVDGGAGIDDLHGGNGRDLIETTSGDLVRGGAGIDQCNIGVGGPAQLRSCGVNANEAPVPSGLVASNGFTLPAGGTTWSGNIFGLLPLERDAQNPAPGRCFAVVGEITANSISQGVTSDPNLPPLFGVIVGGQYIQSTALPCNTNPVETRGFTSLFETAAVPGTAVPFFAEIWLPNPTPGQIEEIVVGAPANADPSLRFEPNVLTFAPTRRFGTPVGALPVGDPVGVEATFTTNRPSGTDWSGKVTDIVEVPVQPWVTRAGTCYLVLGSLVPTKIGTGGPVTNPADVPQIGGIMGGRYRPSSSECDPSFGEAVGADWLLEGPQVTLGSTYFFYVGIFVPTAYDGDLSRIVIDDPTGRVAVFRR